MKKTLLLVLATAGAKAQVTIGNGNHVMEISGGVSTYYNQRMLKSGENDHSKDRFKLRDAQLEVEGRVGAEWEYGLKIDFADIAANQSGAPIDPENPGLMEATATYKGLQFFEVQVGYGKLYYSRSALVPFDYSPYWQRPELTRGSVFSTRDIGVTLIRSFWKQRANAYLGAYSGLGELSLQGDNDASGNPEFAGRIDMAWPSRYRYREIDDRITPIPMFAVGINGRFENKTQPDGEVLPDMAGAEYGLKVINGKKYTYGFDAAFQYMGFSAQFEMHQLKLEPADPASPLFQNLTSGQTHGYVLAGGYFGQANYYIKPWSTLVSARYEQLDLNDLVAGHSERLSAALVYYLNGYNAQVRLQYFDILKEETIDPLKWDEQWRIGLVLQFK